MVPYDWGHMNGLRRRQYAFLPPLMAFVDFGSRKIFFIDKWCLLGKRPTIESASCSDSSHSGRVSEPKLAAISLPLYPLSTLANPTDVIKSTLPPLLLSPSLTPPSSPHPSPLPARQAPPLHLDPARLPLRVGRRRCPGAMERRGANGDEGDYFVGCAGGGV